MKRMILNYLKYFTGTIIALLIAGITVLIYLNGSIAYNMNELGFQVNKDGPYVFYENDSTIQVNYLKVSRKEGLYLDQTLHSIKTPTPVSCFFTLDSSSFDFELDTNFEMPTSVFDDGEPIIAISDIESAYQTFRDFLIQSKVIDYDLNWIFNKGHLVLVGDFVDRGSSTTQVLWLIYKLEQAAKKQGGNVHFIVGNHELKNFQGRYKSASPKYYGVTTILGRHLNDLYSSDSFIGRWLASKNTIERINGVLFAHGGIHPSLADYDISIEQVNVINRANYYQSYYPKPEKSVNDLVLSTKNGICWYRGYFKGKLNQLEVEKAISKFKGKSIVVGHTIQRRVKNYLKAK